MRKKASVADVAAAAEVSIATVSRVLNNPSLVKPELRERVLRASRSLGYVPHGAARALASNRTRSIGVVVPTLGAAVFARGVEALQNRLQEADYRLLVADSQYDSEKEYQEIRALLAHGIDGLVLVGNERLSETRTLLKQQGSPVVISFVHESSEDYPAVGFDNFASGYALARYLLGLGHRRFSLLTSAFATNDRVRARRDGVLRSIEDFGDDARMERALTVDYTMEAGRIGLRRVLDEAPETTCLVATTDVIAVGAHAEAQRLGLRVPQDLSIAGHDGLDFTSYLSPSLTTVEVPSAAIGAAAAERMLGLLAGKGEARAPLVLDAPLLVRESTAPPRPPSPLVATRPISRD